jgi:hypothetical protein
VEQRAAYLGVPVSAEAIYGTLWNDEVSAENFSPRVYREAIAPFDRQVSDTFGGGLVFHSCGRTTPLMGEIAAVAPWAWFHVSAWSDLEAALASLPRVPLLVCLHPYTEVLQAEPARLAERVREIRSRCAGRPFRLCLTELLPVHGPEEDLRRIKGALAVCQEALLG